MSGVGIALLAAGAGRRFKGGDKLMAPLNGVPVCVHAARAARALAADHYWAVVPSDTHGRTPVLAGEGFTPLVNSRTDEGQATSVAFAAKHARVAGLDRLVITLADMPFVTPAHLAALAEAARSHAGVMSLSDGMRQPPACFQRAAFPALEQLSGDAGARSVYLTLSPRTDISMPPEMARDIDTLADLEIAHG